MLGQLFATNPLDDLNQSNQSGMGHHQQDDLLTKLRLRGDQPNHGQQFTLADTWIGTFIVFVWKFTARFCSQLFSSQPTWVVTQEDILTGAAFDNFLAVFLGWKSSSSGSGEGGEGPVELEDAKLVWHPQKPIFATLRQNGLGQNGVENQNNQNGGVNHLATTPMKQQNSAHLPLSSFAVHDFVRRKTYRAVDGLASGFVTCFDWQANDESGVICVGMETGISVGFGFRCLLFRVFVLFGVSVCAWRFGFPFQHCMMT